MPLIYHEGYSVDHIVGLFHKRFKQIYKDQITTNINNIKLCSKSDIKILTIIEGLYRDRILISDVPGFHFSEPLSQPLLQVSLTAMKYVSTNHSGSDIYQTNIQTRNPF